MIAAHGVERAPGAGATFRVHLPLRAGRRATPAALPA